MHSINQSITKKIESEKARLNIPWTTIAECAGLTSGALSRRRSGSIDWTATEVAEIATFLRIPFMDFFATEDSTFSHAV